MIIQWSTYAVFRLFLLSFIGNYIGFAIFEQFRLISKNGKSINWIGPRILLSLISLGFGGIMICGTNIVGIATLGLAVNVSTKSYLRNKYSYLLIACVSSLALCYFGLLLPTQSKEYIKDETDRIEDYIQNAKTLSISEIRKLKKKTDVLKESLVKDIHVVLMGGLVIGIANGVSFYLVVQSFMFNGSAEYFPGVIVAYLLLSVSLGCLCCWVLFRVMSLYPESELLRLSCVSILGLLNLALFFIGTQTFHFQISSTVSESPSFTSDSISSNVLVTSVTRICVVSCAVALVIAIVNMRVWYQNLSRIIRAADSNLADLQRMGTQSAKVNFIEDYEELRRLSGSSIDMLEYKKKKKSRKSRKKPQSNDSAVGTGTPGSPASPSSVLFRENLDLGHSAEEVEEPRKGSKESVVDDVQEMTFQQLASSYKKNIRQTISTETASTVQTTSTTMSSDDLLTLRDEDKLVLRRSGGNNGRLFGEKEEEDEEEKWRTLTGLVRVNVSNTVWRLSSLPQQMATANIATCPVPVQDQGAGPGPGPASGSSPRTPRSQSAHEEATFNRPRQLKK